MITSKNRPLAGDYSGDLAKSYIERRFASSNRMRRIHLREANFARETAKLLESNSLILDVPCGSGRFTSVFTQSGFVCSIDLSEDMLKEAKEGASDEHRGAFVKASALDIPVADSSVDLFFCMRLIHHFGDPETRKRLLCEIARVSKRWVAISFYRKESWRYYRKILFGKKISGQPITMELFEHEAMECGLTVVNMQPSKPQAYLDSSFQTLVLLEKVID